ncbi:TonB-dependent receptor plug domain-containing protein, partial [Escherichia coli]|nr:TonB-dependent receptor plug domain-containing protein [Escherichia coli]
PRGLRKRRTGKGGWGGEGAKGPTAPAGPGPGGGGRGRTNYGMNGGGRPLVGLVDGVRLNSSRTDSRQLDSIDPFNIDHIEVISGATSLYGGGSTGGLINIVTKKGQPETMMEFEAGTKSGFSRSKDPDEAIAGPVPGGMSHTPAGFSVASHTL